MTAQLLSRGRSPTSASPPHEGRRPHEDELAGDVGRARLVMRRQTEGDLRVRTEVTSVVGAVDRLPDVLFGRLPA